MSMKNYIFTSISVISMRITFPDQLKQHHVVVFGIPYLKGTTRGHHFGGGVKFNDQLILPHPSL
jgi:hypothetical protein